MFFPTSLFEASWRPGRQSFSWCFPPGSRLQRRRTAIDLSNGSTVQKKRSRKRTEVTRTRNGQLMSCVVVLACRHLQSRLHYCIERVFCPAASALVLATKTDSQLLLASGSRFAVQCKLSP